MDYKVILKNIKLTESMRNDIEEKLEEVRELSSGYHITKLYISKYEDEVGICFELLREEESLKSTEEKSVLFSEALEKAKDSLLESILKAFVLAAS